jgi:glyoxylase-like metal-dependent hydrolase (beta-lactamase superfamily II)/rhodanese-related sulfurtransferase
MLLRELNRAQCKTYLLACEKSGEAILIDPLREHIDRYIALMAYRRLHLLVAIDTHSHADHRSAAFDLKNLCDCKVLMHRNAPQPHVDIHVDDGGRFKLGEFELKFIATPGHTPDGMCVHVGNFLFTGDTLMIHGTGRADFAGGDAGAQYDSIVNKLFTLPDETIVLPAHDYRGNTRSTIGEEKASNPRLAGVSRDEYLRLMSNLGLPLPDKIQEVLQPNQSAVEGHALKFPTLAQLNQVRQLAPELLIERLNQRPGPLLIDVREPAEFNGELGHVPGARLLPLAQLTERAGELQADKERDIVLICRVGVRSTTAAAILSSLDFQHVSNLKGGMIAWNDAGLPVEHDEPVDIGTNP